MQLSRLALRVLLVFGVADLAAQDFNLELVAEVDFVGEFGSRGSDVWGYVDGAGVEYAVVGTRAATLIYSLEDPAAPNLRARITGASSIWRDIKSYGDYVYVVTDQGRDGLLVIDMSGAPQIITHSFYVPIAAVAGSTQQALTNHNLYISREGYLVLAGGSRFGGRPLVFDLNADPEEPPFVGAARGRYAHDVYAEGGRLYSSDINDGELTVHDFTDPSDITALGSATTSRVFTHNAWPSEDGSATFTTDEKAGAFVDAYDTSDPREPRLVDRFRPDHTFESRSIPHNTHHVDGGYLVTSWYEDGVIVTDASRPHNLVHVGTYDTYARDPEDPRGFSGAWGAYPYLPSGLVLASNIEDGLFVLRPTYERGCYLEGTVVDSVDGFPLAGAVIDFDGRPAQRTTSDIGGDYATGIYAEGTYPVTVSHPQCVSKTFDARMVRGEVNLRRVELDCIPDVTVGIDARDPEGAPVAAPQFALTYLGRAGGTASGLGVFDVLVGAWGYRSQIIRGLELPTGDSTTVRVALQPGLYDDFAFDFGWEASGTATTGRWARGLPQQTTADGTAVQLGRDVAFDFGGAAFVTGNAADEDATVDDVDGGTAVLTSPAFDATGYCADAVLEFSYYFYNGGGGGNPDDSLVLTIENGLGERYDTVLARGTSTADWTRARTIALASALTLTDAMTVSFRTSDFAASGHLVEAMVDAISLASAEVSRAAIAPDTVRGCPPLTVDLDVDLPDGDDRFAWSYPQSDSVDGTAATFETPGAYDAVVTVTDDAGCATTERFANLIQVEPLVVAGYETIDNGDGAVSFFDLSTGASEVRWDFGDGATSEEQFTEHRYTGAGPFTVTLTAAGFCGRDSLSFTLTPSQTSAVNDAAERLGIRLVANPVTEVLVVETSRPEATALRLVDLAGRPAGTWRVSGRGRHELQTEAPAGVYVLTADGQAVARVAVAPR